METKTNIKAGGLSDNHNEAPLVAVPVKTRIKAGVVPDSPDFTNDEGEPGAVAVRTGVKAGRLDPYKN